MLLYTIFASLLSMRMICAIAEIIAPAFWPCLCFFPEAGHRNSAVRGSRTVRAHKHAVTSVNIDIHGRRNVRRIKGVKFQGEAMASQNGIQWERRGIVSRMFYLQVREDFVCRQGSFAAVGVVNVLYQ
jgi:hypothetical protein